MTDRRRYKQWSYALFYFIETNEVGIGKTTLVVDGYKNLSKGSYVKVHWPGDTREYIARVLDLADTQMGLSKREQEAIEAIDNKQLRTLKDEATLSSNDDAQTNLSKREQEAIEAIHKNQRTQEADEATLPNNDDTQTSLSKREQEAIEAIDKNQRTQDVDEATLPNNDDTQTNLSKKEQETVEAIDKNQLRTEADEFTSPNNDADTSLPAVQAEKESPPASLSQVETIKEDVSAIKQQLGRVLSNQCSILDSLAKLSDGSCAPPNTYPFFSPLPIPDFLSFNPPMQSTGGATQTGLGNTTIPSLVNQPFCPSQIPLSQPTFQVTPHASVEQDQLNDNPYPGMPPSPPSYPSKSVSMAFPRAVSHAASQDTSQPAHLAPIQAAHQASPQPAHETAPQAAYQATPQDAHQASPQTAHQDAPKTGKLHHKPRSLPAESVIDELYRTRPKYNFCVRLLSLLYNREELVDCSVNGGHGKRPLNTAAKLFLRETFFMYYPAASKQEQEEEWKRCTNALNAHLCKYVNKHK